MEKISMARALYEFDHTYLNPFHLALETNYRSKQEIVDVANRLIQRNPGRRPKNMVANRGYGGAVKFIEVENRENQIDYLVEELRDNHNDTAVIYRNNETAIGIIDAFERNEIPYYVNKANELFFSSRLLNDIICFFKFAMNPNDETLLTSLYYKLNERYFSSDMVKHIGYWSKKNGLSLLDQFIEQTTYLPNKTREYKERRRDSAETFKYLIERISKSTPLEAVNIIVENGYAGYAFERNISMNSLGSIKSIASNTKTLTEFIKRIDELNGKVKNKLRDKERKPDDIVLSTIHSCKVMEFSKVIIIDVINGILPSRSALYLENDARFGYYAEETRLFYVAITRAKNEVVNFRIKNEKQDFIDFITNWGNRYKCIFYSNK